MKAVLTYPASKLFKTSLRLDVFCMYAMFLNVAKRMKFETNWIF